MSPLVKPVAFLSTSNESQGILENLNVKIKLFEQQLRSKNTEIEQLEKESEEKNEQLISNSRR